MTVFGVTIPLWALVVAAVLVFIFRSELAELFRRLFSLVSPKKPHAPDPEIQAYVLQALSAHDVKIGDISNFNGQRLVAVLKAFRDFLAVIANVTPHRVDDVAVRFIGIMVSVLEQHPDVAEMISRFINLLVSKNGNKNNP